jgi:hypothetical protein
MNPTPTAGRAREEMLNVKPTMCTIQAVTVVPIFAPMITPIDWVKVRRPALTKDTTITVVADEDCTIAVTPKPVIIAVTRLPVINPRTRWSRDPAVFWIPSLMIFIPYRKRPRLPRIRKSIIRYSIADNSTILRKIKIIK